MNYLNNIKLITLISIALVCNVVSAREQLVLASDNWCPYTCDSKSESPGYVVELATQAFALQGIDVEYRMMPLYDAIKAAEKGEIDGVIAISRRENDLIYPTQPQIHSVKKAYIRTNDYWHYDSPNSLQGKVLCSVLDYTMDSNTRRYFTSNYTMNPKQFVIEEGADANSACIANVANGSSDVYIADQNVVVSAINNSKLENMLKAVDVLGAHPQPLFVTFSPKLAGAKEYADKLVRAIDSMQSLGDTKELAVKYGLCKTVTKCDF